MGDIAVYVNPCILENKKKAFFCRKKIKKVTHSRISVSTPRAVLVYAERFVDKDIRALSIRKCTKRKCFLLSEHFAMHPDYLISRFNMTQSGIL